MDPQHAFCPNPVVAAATTRQHGFGSDTLDELPKWGGVAADDPIVLLVAKISGSNGANAPALLRPGNRSAKDVSQYQAASTARPHSRGGRHPCGRSSVGTQGQRLSCPLAGESRCI